MIQTFKGKKLEFKEKIIKQKQTQNVLGEKKILQFRPHKHPTE